jgi:hypothetical protein
LVVEPRFLPRNHLEPILIGRRKPHVALDVRVRSRFAFG